MSQGGPHIKYKGKRGQGLSYAIMFYIKKKLGSQVFRTPGSAGKLDCTVFLTSTLFQMAKKRQAAISDAPVVHLHMQNQATRTA